MTTIRLPDDLKNNIDNIAKHEHKSKSEIIKIALKNYIQEYYNLSPYEMGKDLFGKYGSGQSGNSQNYKQKIKDKISDKFSN